MDLTSSLMNNFFCSEVGPNIFSSCLEDRSISPVFLDNMMQCEESLLVVCKKNSGPELSVLKQGSTHRPSTISTVLKWSLLVLVLFTPVANAQSVQTIQSEAQLASVL